MKKANYLGPLRSGQRVVIIGGGPGGAGCAIALKNLCRKRNIDLHVVIYEGKVFKGERQFNQCAGVLSPPIKQIMEELIDVSFPENLVQKNITGYMLHSDVNRIFLDGSKDPSYALRRIKFDEYLLEKAVDLGVEVITGRVVDLEFCPDKVMVYSECNNYRADVVVGAFGLDDGTAKIFERHTDYRQPQFLTSIITKIHPGMDFLREFGNIIHAFLPSYREIEFGAITPKENHLTLNIAGKDITADSMERFLDYTPVKAILPPHFLELRKDLSFYKGKFPISTARGIYGDRYVTIGDASGLIRPFKGKGVNAGILTGLRAARTMIQHGISREDFKYYYESCREVIKDLPYGRILRQLANKSANLGVLPSIIQFAERDDSLREALFNCVSAHKTFKKIYEETRSLELAFRLIGIVGGSILKRDENLLNKAR
ncbi:MAG: NAD(P)/FAD-dependent oxidoreductase [Fidelibacterota bacterium]